jgi:phosphatidylglycerophosphatase A
MSEPAPNPATTTTSSAKRKLRVSLAIATAFGLGYLPKAPGTFGSLAGLVPATFPLWFIGIGMLWGGGMHLGTYIDADPFVLIQCGFAIGIALLGLWSAHRASKYWNTKDPQKVVIDEVSGQQLALLLGGFYPLRAPPANNPWNFLPANRPILWATHPLGASMWISPNWKYLLLGFILFRVFDIWKPFPARQAESLPGGLGIMADDWVAGIYAALCLWGARAIGL